MSAEVKKKRVLQYRYLLLIAGVVALLVGYFLLCQKQQKSAVPIEKVTFAEPTQPGAGPVYIAYIKGYFKDEGLDVTLQPHTSGKAALNAVLGGKADLAVVAETPIMFAVVRGEKIYAIATLFTSEKNMAIIARKDREISLPADLKGKRIGVSIGTNGEFFMDAFLVLHGIPVKEVKAVNLKPEEMFDSLVKGKVDAVSTWHPHLMRLQKKFGDIGITFYGDGIYTWTFNVAVMQEFAHKNSEVIQRIHRTLIKAVEHIRENPDESCKIIADYIRMDESMLRELWTIYNFGITLDQSLLINLENQTRWAIKNKLADKTEVPNYLNFIYLDGLKAVKPKAVTIIR
jgi:ABC-type nitrate/sulfonate/bicarbonate transport system substrate-binding protein